MARSVGQRTSIQDRWEEHRFTEGTVFTHGAGQREVNDTGGRYHDHVTESTLLVLFTDSKVVVFWLAVLGDRDADDVGRVKVLPLLEVRVLAEEAVTELDDGTCNVKDDRVEVLDLDPVAKSSSNRHRDRFRDFLVALVLVLNFERHVGLDVDLSHFLSDRVKSPRDEDVAVHVLVLVVLGEP
jgi:hypothetical protein